MNKDLLKEVNDELIKEEQRHEKAMKSLELESIKIQEEQKAFNKKMDEIENKLEILKKEHEELLNMNDEEFIKNKDRYNKLHQEYFNFIKELYKINTP